MDGLLVVRNLLGSPLRGKIDGRKHFGQLCTALSGNSPGSVVRLDFDGIEDLSASWIAAAALPLLTWSASPENDLYPVLLGINNNTKKWEDEFELVAGKANVIFLAEISKGHGKILGALDPILVHTLDLVQQNGDVTGAGLKRFAPDEYIGATAWSNRLRDLHSMRLVRRISRGREQIYSAVLEVNFDGATTSGFANRPLSKTEAT